MERERYNLARDGEISVRLLKRYLAAILLLLFALFSSKSVLAQPVRLHSSQSSANDLIAEVNALRVANGLPAYTVNSILMHVAQDQANFMAATGQVAHRPGLTQRILDAGYPLAGDLSQGGFRAENITGGNKTAAQAIQGWTGDSLHLNTMLSPNLTEIGAGVAKVGNSYYMVIDCAQPTTSGQPQAYTPDPGSPAVNTPAPLDFIVPIVISTPDESGLVYHEVQYGQTLWAIAIGYGVKIDEIRALNGLGQTTEIYQGDRLLVRKDAPALTTATPVKVTAPASTMIVRTSTSFPSLTPIITEVSSAVAESPDKNSMAGIVLGVVLVVALIAGVLTWRSSQKFV
jgi:uncharacterized protein YkwD/LysM repeat protein